MVRFFGALAAAMFFFAKMDILIWQRVFETNQLWKVQYDFIPQYHLGWTQALLGYMVLGVLLFYPNIRRMITYPLSLFILAFSGLEDILYYWMDGRPIPGHLPWLSQNPMILQPVTDSRLVISALFWLVFVALLEALGKHFERRVAHLPAQLAVILRKKGNRVLFYSNEVLEAVMRIARGNIRSGN